MNRFAFAAAAILAAACPALAAAAPQHGLAAYGEPALPPGFESLPYANADAPKGGSITYGERGRFDTLNPYTLKGRSPWAMRTHVFESLMARSWDEPFTTYGLLAETVETDGERSFVEFRLRPEARFADGSPVTAEDVRWSMETLRDEGRPVYRGYYERVAEVLTPDARTVRFVFAKPDRELPMLLGLMPVLSKDDWEGKDFAATTLEPPVGSGPYRVAEVGGNDRLVLERREDYWGRDLPVNRGIHNFDRVTYLYFRDQNAVWEAFTAGDVDEYRDLDPGHWEDAYGFPAARDGRVERDEISHGRATGMEGFVFNTRRPAFADRRVREALTLAFDFEWLNEAINRGAFERIGSYFDNSDLGFAGRAEGREREILAPFADDLPPGTLDEGWSPPVSSGDGRNRRNLREASKLLREAGYRVDRGTLVGPDGAPLRFEILLGSKEDEKVAAAFAKSLERLGIEVDLRLVESAQYQARLNEYDFDMILRRWVLSLSPGGEQRFYFGSDGRERPGTRNYMGADEPAIDAAIDALLAAKTAEEHRAAARALDRVLVAGRYVIPLWYQPSDRLAWWKPLAKPKRDPLYGYRPEVWYSEQ